MLRAPHLQRPPYLEEAYDRHLAGFHQGLGSGDVRQGGGSRACALLQPVHDVVRLPASCDAARDQLRQACAQQPGPSARPTTVWHRPWLWPHPSPHGHARLTDSKWLSPVTPGQSWGLHHKWPSSPPPPRLTLMAPQAGVSRQAPHIGGLAGGKLGAEAWLQNPAAVSRSVLPQSRGGAWPSCFKGEQDKQATPSMGQGLQEWPGRGSRGPDHTPVFPMDKPCQATHLCTPWGTWCHRS